MQKSSILSQFLQSRLVSSGLLELSRICFDSPKIIQSYLGLSPYEDVFSKTESVFTKNEGVFTKNFYEYMNTVCRSF